jgi:hypothetical protein
MRNTVKKRAPHGATSTMVMDALWRLHTQGGRRIEVSRVDLLSAVPLPETTVDDRLRTLVKEGRVLRAGRAFYVPKPWPGTEPLRPEPRGTEKSDSPSEWKGLYSNVALKPLGTALGKSQTRQIACRPLLT